MGKDEQEFGEDELDQDLPTITLTLEDDTELECSVIGTFDVDDLNYIALVPINGDEVMIYQFSEDDEGNMNLSLIESEEEFEKVSSAFNELFDDEFDDSFDDEDEDR